MIEIMRVHPSLAGQKQLMGLAPIQVERIIHICERPEVGTPGVTLGSVCHIKLKS